MKHKIATRTLGRKAHHRQQLFRQQCRDLLRHGFLVTTSAKAKELRRIFEPLVAEAGRELTLHRRRQLLRHIGDASAVARLRAVAEAQSVRPGGTLRLTRLPQARSDGAGLVRVDIMPVSGQDGTQTDT